MKPAVFRLGNLGRRQVLLDPQGHSFLALGLNHFEEAIAPGEDPATIQARAIDDLRRWGFNTSCYHAPPWLAAAMPHLQSIHLLPTTSWLPDERFAFVDVFDPTVVADLVARCTALGERWRDDALLIGYCWTDLPVWGGVRPGRGGWIDFFRTLPADSPGGRRLRAWQADHPTVSPAEFLPVIAGQVYATAHAALRRADPHHLILGDRYHEDDIPSAIVQAALPWIDILAVQPTSHELDPAWFDALHAATGKPIYIVDHVSGYATCDHPHTLARHTCPDAAAYVAYYQRYLEAAFALPYLIGYHKCQYRSRLRPGVLKQGLRSLAGDEDPVAAALANLHHLVLASALQEA